MKAKSIEIGDKVMYSKEFLRSTGMFTGPIPFARGVVKSLVKLGELTTLAEVEWGNEEIPPRVNVKNLSRVPS